MHFQLPSEDGVGLPSLRTGEEPGHAPHPRSVPGAGAATCPLFRACLSSHRLSAAPCDSPAPRRPDSRGLRSSPVPVKYQLVKCPSHPDSRWLFSSIHYTASCPKWHRQVKEKSRRHKRTYLGPGPPSSFFMIVML